MSYSTYDASVQDGSPVHLFQFVYETVTYRFTDLPSDYVALGNTWTSAPIRLGEIETTEEMHKNNLDLDFPRNDSFASLFLSETQDYITSVTVYRGYANDPDSEFITYWKGRVSNNRVKKNTITLTCESIFTSLKRPGLRGRFSKQCRHTLYGRGCNLDPEDSSSILFYVEDIVSDVSSDGLILTIEAAALQDDDYYRGGMVRAPDSVYRFIKAHTGNLITISNPHVGFVASDFVQLYPGCDRSIATCVERFDNIQNFGGFPYSPKDNPFSGTRL